MTLLITQDRERVTVNDTAAGLTSAKAGAAGIQYALITNTGSYTANYTVDGTTATNANGNLLNPGDAIEVWTSNDLLNFSIIRNGASNTSIEVTYFGTRHS